MIKIFLGYFVLFCLFNLARASRVRLCVQTNNYEKLQPTCVLCPSRQQLAKTMELCTGSSDYQSNITFQQAKCLISICNRNQLPSDLQQANQLIESNTKNNNFANKFARPGSKQQLVHYSSQHSLSAAEMNGNNLNGPSSGDQQQSDGESVGLTSPAGDLTSDQQGGDLVSSGKPILSADSLVTNSAMISDGSSMASSQNNLNGLNGLNGLNSLNGNHLNANAVTNWPQSTAMPSKLIFKRKPFKFRFWPFFG